LQANDARLSAKVYAVGGVLYAAQNTELNNRLAIRWYRVRAADNVLLESGTIADPNVDLFFPSIAANPSGVVVIAFNGSGPGTLVSSFAMAGQTVGGTTTFGSRVLLQAGAISYHGDDEQFASTLGTLPLSRWGDYSATSVDPADPTRFWTIQMIPDDPANNDVWTTYITELVTAPQVLLSIALAKPNVILSWPAGPASYQLQSIANLASGGTWSNVLQAPVTNSSLVSVTLPASAAHQFFRLQKQ